MPEAVRWRTSCPAPLVRTARKRLVRVARTYSTEAEAPGRTCKLSSALSMVSALKLLSGMIISSDTWPESHRSIVVSMFSYE